MEYVTATFKKCYTAGRNRPGLSLRAIMCRTSTPLGAFCGVFYRVFHERIIMKNAEELAGLRSLFAEREREETPKKSSKGGRKDAQIEANYHLDCMSPVRRYTKTHTPPPKTPNTKIGDCEVLSIKKRKRSTKKVYRLGVV